MKDKDKTKDQLLFELVSFRQRVNELEASKAECKQMDAALSESEERYHSLVESTEDAVYLINRNDIYLYANKRYLQRLDLPLDKVVGHNYGEFHSDNDTCKFGKIINRVFHTSKSVVYEHQSHRDYRYFLRTLSPVIDPKNGEINAVTVISKDITERKRWEEELKQSYEKLRKSLEGTVNALAAISENRDPYTAGHQQRMSYLACAIAREMGLSDDQIEGIRVAGILHDIGKIAVPIEILIKPGKLTTLEMSIIKTHPQVGYDILKMIEFPWPVAQIVLQHHERINGTGYPQGLSKNNIILEARIISIADIVEAMSYRRPYREAHGLQEALKELIEGKDVYYDPEVVEVCVKLFQEKKFQFYAAS